MWCFSAFPLACFSPFPMSSFFDRECSVRILVTDNVDFGRFAGPDPRVSFRGLTARRGQPFVAVRVCVFPLPSRLSSVRLLRFEVCLFSLLLFFPLPPYIGALPCFFFFPLPRVLWP